MGKTPAGEPAREFPGPVESDDKQSLRVRGSLLDFPENYVGFFK